MWCRIVAMVAGLVAVLLFVFMHETFWDRREPGEDREKTPTLVTQQTGSESSRSDLSGDTFRGEPGVSEKDVEGLTISTTFTDRRTLLPALPFRSHLQPFRKYPLWL